MVNRRRPLGVAQENSVATAAQIESFGSAADGNKGMDRVDKSKHLDPQGTRNYKNIRLPFNEFEYARLEHFSAILGRSKLSFIRCAVTNLIQQLEDEEV